VSTLRAIALFLSCFVTVGAEGPDTLSYLASRQMHAEPRHSGLVEDIPVSEFTPHIQREMLAGEMAVVVGNNLTVPLVRKFNYRPRLKDHSCARGDTCGKIPSCFGRKNFGRMEPDPDIVGRRLAVILVLHAQSDDVRVLHAGIRGKEFRPDIGPQLALGGFLGAKHKLEGCPSQNSRDDEQPNLGPPYRLASALVAVGCLLGGMQILLEVRRRRRSAVSHVVLSCLGWLLCFEGRAGTI